MSHRNTVKKTVWPALTVQKCTAEISQDCADKIGTIEEKNCKARYTLFVNMTNRGTKLFFHRIKYCWWKRDECVAVHCSLFAVNFSAADNFFFRWKSFLCLSKRPLPRRKSCVRRTAKNLFAKHGEHLL